MSVFQYKDDPELGYVDSDYVIDTEHGPMTEEGGELVPVELVYSCSICENDIEDPEAAVYPLCRSCEGTARAGGRMLAEAQRQRAEGVR